MAPEVAQPALSVVVPLFNEEGNVAPLLERIVAIVERLPGTPSYEIVLVNDGSTDGTLAAIRAEMARRAHVVLVSLSRNFGHQLAATAGIEIAAGDAVVLMDGDLQDPPELIEAFLQRWRDGFDVVYAVRRTRKGESPFKLFTASLFYRTIKRLTKVSIPVDTGDFRLMSRRVVEALRRSPERHRFLRGMVSWVGYNQTGVEYDRDERLSGTTKYPLPKMIRFAIDGITSFSDIPLRFASYFGFGVSAIAFVYAVIVIGYKLFSLKPPGYTPGWASTIAAVLFLGGVQLMSLGILGEYIGRVYDEVKARPLYLIADIEAQLTYRPVIDQFHLPVPLDPACVALFTLAFLAAIFLCTRRASYGLACLILVQPFDVSRDVLGTTISLPKVVLLGVLVGLATYAGVLRLARDRPAPLLFAAIGAYLTATILSFTGSTHDGATLRECFKVFEYAILFGAAYLCYRVDPSEGVVANAIAIVTIAVALSALAQELLGAPSGLYVGAAIVPRIAGALEGPNQLAGYFEIAIATLGALAIARRSVLFDVALALATCADVLTFSRAGLLGLLLVGGVLFAVARRDALRALLPAFAGFVAGLAGVAGWVIYAQSPDVLRVSFGGPEYAGGVGNRGELYRAAWRMFLRHPLTGVGAGNYELLLPAYGLEGVRTHANSWYLQSLAEGGIALFAATAGVVVATLTTFGKSLRDGSPWVLAAFAAGLAMALHQIIDYLVFYPKVGATLWLLFGIGAAAIAARRTTTQ